MSELIPFPSQMTQDWRLFQSSLENMLEQQGLSEAFKQHIFNRMKMVFHDYHFSLNIPLNLPDEYIGQVRQDLMTANKTLSQHYHQLLLSRLELEIELAQCQGIS